MIGPRTRSSGTRYGRSASGPLAPPTWAWCPSGERASLRCTKGQGDEDCPRWVSRVGVGEVRFDDAAVARHERRPLNARWQRGCVRRLPCQATRQLRASGGILRRRCGWGHPHSTIPACSRNPRASSSSSSFRRAVAGRPSLSYGVNAAAAGRRSDQIAILTAISSNIASGALGLRPFPLRRLPSRTSP